METILSEIEYVYCYLDDVLIAGQDFDDCYRRLTMVLDRLAKANVKVNFSKCNFFVSQLPYLGHILSENGLLPNPEKVSTINAAQIPKNSTELKAFLGLVNYYGKFLPNLSTTLNPLYCLLKKDVRFTWDFKCDEAFKDCKLKLLNADVLTYYDPKKPIVVSTDASSYGLGGVISHIIDGIEKPIWFTSFSLNQAQKNYPILHLEALAVVSTVKKFHKFLFGQSFTIFTDHKPLLGIFGKTGRNSISVTRIQRYVIELAIYDYNIEYRPANKMANADFCSRFPLNVEVPKCLEKQYVNSLNFSQEMPLDSSIVAKETHTDFYLQQIIAYMKNGWPERVDVCFRNIFSQHRDLEVIDGCLLFQDRVIVPVSLQKRVLQILHANHTGIIKMKQQARRSIYWFGINCDIESYVKNCEVCAKTSVASNEKHISEWIPTTRPFSRVHADFFYFERRTYLLIVDSFSKWLEIKWMKYGTDSEKVIKKFIEFFAQFGLPDVVVTDNGPPFNAKHFTFFLEKQGIQVFKSPPYHPQSNGQAERLVRVSKEVLKKFLLDPTMRSMDLQDKINYFLFNYRNTCLSDGGKYPSEKVLCFKPKTVLDLVNPKNNYKRHLAEPLELRDENSIDDVCDPYANLKLGDKVYYKNHNPKDIEKWINATFVKRISKNVLQIAIGSTLVSAHKGQVKIQNSQSGRRRHCTLHFSDSEGGNGGTRTIPERADRSEIHARGTKRTFSEADDSADEFLGFEPEQPMPASRELHPISLQPFQRPVQQLIRNESRTPRRSSRLKKKKHDDAFVYMN